MKRSFILVEERIRKVGKTAAECRKFVAKIPRFLVTWYFWKILNYFYCKCIYIILHCTNRPLSSGRFTVAHLNREIDALGNFSSPKVEEFVISRGNTIELWRPDDAGNINIICSFEVYGLIRSIKPFRLSGIAYWFAIKPRK